MQPDRLERRNVVQRRRRVKHLQPRYRFGDIHPAELRLAVNREAFSRAVGEAHNHPLNMPLDTCHVKHVINAKA